MKPINVSHIASKWWVMLAVTLGMFMSLLDSTIVNVAIPQLQRVFGADLEHIQWVTTIYMITQAAVIPTAPFLTRRLGSKRAYTWSLGAFLVGSVLCGLAWSLPSLIVFRLLQGIGGGTLLPLVMTLLYQAFPVHERGRAVSVMGVPLMVAPLLGPALGGLLVSYWGWPWAFFINIPLGLVALGIAQRFLEPGIATRNARFDGLGFLTAAAGSVGLLYGVTAVTEQPGPLSLGLLGAGSLALVLFAVIERYRARRGYAVLLDLRRFTDPTFLLSNVSNILVAFTRFGIIFLIPVYLQVLRQHSAAEAGSMMSVQALATLVTLFVIGRVADRVGPRTVALTGLALLAGGSALLMTLSLTTPLEVILAIFVVMGCAFAMTQQLPVAAMSNIDRYENTEIANGSTLVSVLQATAAPLGVAMLSSLVHTRAPHYRATLTAPGLSAQVLERQSTLSAMHESFALALGLTLLALVVMTFVPRRTPQQVEQPESMSPAQTLG